MNLRVSSVSQNHGLQRYVKSATKKAQSITKPTILIGKESAIILSAGSLAASLTATDFLNKTKVSDANKLYTSGHWVDRPPMDGSDYPHQVWVEDPPSTYIYGSGEPPSED